MRACVQLIIIPNLSNDKLLYFTSFQRLIIYYLAFSYLKINYLFIYYKKHVLSLKYKIVLMKVNK